jgi:hypothetical protein
VFALYLVHGFYGYVIVSCMYGTCLGLFLYVSKVLCTDKKEKKISLIYKEIQKGAVAKSYMRKGFLIYEEMRKYLVIHI